MLYSEDNFNNSVIQRCHNTTNDTMVPHQKCWSVSLYCFLSAHWFRKALKKTNQINKKPQQQQNKQNQKQPEKPTKQKGLWSWDLSQNNQKDSVTWGVKAKDSKKIKES